MFYNYGTKLGKMFDNCGAKLKVTVTIIATFVMALCILSGVILFLIMVRKNILLALVSLIVVPCVGCLCVWLSCLVIATFAEIAINTERTAKLLEDLQKSSSERSTQSASAAQSEPHASPVTSRSVISTPVQKTPEDLLRQYQGKIPAWKRVEMEMAASKEEQLKTSDEER